MFGLFKKPDNSAYWEAIANRNEKKAVENYRKFIAAAKECNAYEDELDRALASNRRLADQLAAKTARLERIVEAFEGQRSGTAKKVVKLARGEA